jgi:hypothetical protein
MEIWKTITMKLTKETLQKMIQEELEGLTSENKYLDALMQLAGLPRSAQATKIDKPITPTDLGPEDEPYTERETVELGDAPPTKEFVIKAAEMLDLIPASKSDENVLYNVAMYLQNIGGDEIDAVVADARAEGEYIKADDALEEDKPSAGLSKKQKSAASKKAQAGKDMGKKGKEFDKIASKAAKKYGSKEAGERVAAAAMWKNMKR